MKGTIRIKRPDWVAINEGGSIDIEWITPDRRVGISLGSSPSDSAWYHVWRGVAGVEMRDTLDMNIDELRGVLEEHFSMQPSDSGEDTP